ncbi:MAG: hypothetical protein IBX55_21450 [Methyloprofundus sp.]|nr:hypothetical protein [Methyloprofundus sp.]
MKKILILMPKGTSSGKPSFERVQAFIEFYKSQELHVVVKDQPSNFLEKIELIKLLYLNKISNIFISMPQFRNWWLFLLPAVNVILDIRDGWSIAMKSGYGGNVKPNRLKAFIASRIEKFAIKRAGLTITCTPGLQQYLEKIAGKEVVLILNSYSKSDENLVAQLKEQVKKERNTNQIVAICVGQFSEYGNDKVKVVLRKLSESYPEKKVLLKLVGADYEKNKWIEDYLAQENIENVRLDILRRMGRREMYIQILLSDIGVTIIRDPDYEFGTKVFDYILCGLPIFYYFDVSNPFSCFFTEIERNINSRETTIAKILNDKCFLK